MHTIVVIGVAYRAKRCAQELAYWMSVPPVRGAAPIERARRFAQMLRRQSNWEVIVTPDGQRVE